MDPKRRERGAMRYATNTFDRLHHGFVSRLRDAVGLVVRLNSLIFFCFHSSICYIIRTWKRKNVILKIIFPVDLFPCSSASLLGQHFPHSLMHLISTRWPTNFALCYFAGPPSLQSLTHNLYANSATLWSHTLRCWAVHYRYVFLFICLCPLSIIYVVL